MKRSNLFLIMPLVLLVLIVGCAERVSEEELAKGLDNLSEEELNYVLSDEEPPLVGQASKFSPNKIQQLNSLRKTTKPYKISCSDSDGGANYTEAGHVTLFNYPGGTIKKSDRCWDDGRRLQEYVCENGKYKGDHTFDCSSLGVGYGCEKRACAPELEIKTLTLENTPGYVGLSNNYDLTLGNIVESDADLRYYERSTQFLRFHRSFLVSPDHSNAGFIYMGEGDLDSYRCPEFKLEQLDHTRDGDYVYFNWWDLPTVSEAIYLNGVYCLLNHDNTKYFLFKVIEITESNITINYQDFGETDVKTYRCADGFCDEEVEVFCIGCRGGDIPFIERVFEMQHTAKSCIEEYLGVRLPTTLKQKIHPNALLPCEGPSECANSGHGGIAVSVYGFQGLINMGETRVTNIEDLRLELHENMHVYTRLMISTRVPSWFNEGMSIQIEARLQCDEPQFDSGFYIGTNEYQDIRDGRISLSDYHRSSSHVLGSLFFKGLEVDYACGADCAAGIWKRLANSSSNHNREVTNQQIKEAAEAELGRDLTFLFELLELV